MQYKTRQEDIRLSLTDKQYYNLCKEVYSCGFISIGEFIEALINEWQEHSFGTMKNTISFFRFYLWSYDLDENMDELHAMMEDETCFKERYLQYREEAEEGTVIEAEEKCKECIRKVLRYLNFLKDGQDRDKTTRRLGLSKRTIRKKRHLKRDIKKEKFIRKMKEFDDKTIKAMIIAWLIYGGGIIHILFFPFIYELFHLNFPEVVFWIIEFLPWIVSFMIMISQIILSIYYDRKSGIFEQESFCKDKKKSKLDISFSFVKNWFWFVCIIL